jgi:hypothetical protein
MYFGSIEYQGLYRDTCVVQGYTDITVVHGNRSNTGVNVYRPSTVVHGWMMSTGEHR